ncbi:unnamed protein product [Musa acuminata var. zebrina]
MASAPFFLLLPVALLLLVSSTLQQEEGGLDEIHTPQTYIVRVRSDLKPSVYPEVEHWYSATLRSLSSSSSAVNESPTRETYRPRALLHVYRTVFHGFSAVLSSAEADLLSSQPGVLAVFPDRRQRPHTTRSPQFLGLLSPASRPNSLLSATDSGSSAVIAVLDTGVRPDHHSFSETGPTQMPPRWRGACEPGPSFPPTSCNKKLVGAGFFSSGFLASTKNASSDVLSPIDTEGHGTHTASTAAGVPVPGASLLGVYAAGIASGVAPKARVAAYKVCWSSGCFDSDILAALDRAVDDGADVISLSVGSNPVPLHLDPIAIGAFGAAEHGVLVSASAGNGGPNEMTVTNVAPWIVTVGASTIDRRFPADVVLGDRTVLTGVSVYAADAHTGPSLVGELPLVYAGNASTSRPGFRSSAHFCMRESLEPALTRGKVVLCERGGIPRVEKGLAVKEAGGAGMIVANQFLDGEGLVPDAHLLPAVNVGYSTGNIIRAYVRSTADARVRLVFRGTHVGVKPAPVVAAFSGRGPSAPSWYLIKPDVVAPGVGILAAWPLGLGPTGLPSDARRTEFNVMSGTSMACPHVSGVAALLRAAHPDWSPAAVRSAMMTTAYVTDSLGQQMLDENSGNRSTAWAHGSGHVDPEKAADPGLIYDLTADDYLSFLCSSNYTEMQIRTIARRAVNCSRNSGRMPWDLNYPSISVVLEQPKESKLQVIAHRTLTNVANGTCAYTVETRAPVGVQMAVDPQQLVFHGKRQKQGFVVNISAEGVTLPPGGWKTEFGSLSWSDGKHTVRSPIAVTWQQAF